LAQVPRYSNEGQASDATRRMPGKKPGDWMRGQSFLLFFKGTFKGPRRILSQGLYKHRRLIIALFWDGIGHPFRARSLDLHQVHASGASDSSQGSGLSKRLSLWEDVSGEC
jgi:hypothetical protein